MSDKRLTETDLLCFTETQLTSNSNLQRIENTLTDFQVCYNNCDYCRFQSLALGYKQSVLVSDMLKCQVYLFFSLEKPQFSGKVLKVALLYRKPMYVNEVFFNRVENLVLRNDIDILLGDFNIDALDSNNNNHTLQTILWNYRLILNKPTYISGSLLDHVYVKKSFLKNKIIDAIVTGVFFSDHDAVQLSLRVE